VASMSHLDLCHMHSWTLVEGQSWMEDRSKSHLGPFRTRSSSLEEQVRS